MSWLNYFMTLLVIFLINFNYETQACGVNEVEKSEPNCISDCCPEEACQPTACPDPCATSCTCQPNYQRASNGTCIPAGSCPSITCPPNEVFDSYPNTFCSESCDDANPTGNRCPRFFGVGPVVIRKAACRCIDNYWRNSAGQCVYYTQCPKFQNGC